MTREELYKIGKNPHLLLRGVRGMLAKERVYRQVNGKTIVSRAPRKPASQTEQQRCNRHRFRLASEFAKRELLDPQRRAHYLDIAEKSGITNAYTAAIKVYMSTAETAIAVVPPAADIPATLSPSPGATTADATRTTAHASVAVRTERPATRRPVDVAGRPGRDPHRQACSLDVAHPAACAQCRKATRCHRKGRPAQTIHDVLTGTVILHSAFFHYFGSC